MTDETLSKQTRRPVDQAETPVTLAALRRLPAQEAEAALLALPRGALAVEGLPVAFGGAQTYPVDDAGAKGALASLLVDEKLADMKFYNQAQAMEAASRHHGYRVGHSLNLVAIPQYSSPLQNPRPIDHEAIDAFGKFLDSKRLEDPEFVGRLSTKDGKSLSTEEAIRKGKEVLERHAKQRQGSWAEKVAAAHRGHSCRGRF